MFRTVRLRRLFLAAVAAGWAMPHHWTGMDFVTETTPMCARSIVAVAGPGARAALVPGGWVLPTTVVVLGSFEPAVTFQVATAAVRDDFRRDHLAATYLDCLDVAGHLTVMPTVDGRTVPAATSGTYPVAGVGVLTGATAPTSIVPSTA